MSDIKTRFAPTVSGPLHLGSVYNALLNFLFAKKNKGQFLLRLDGQRVAGNEQREKWLSDIKSDLEWLGLKWDQEYIQTNRKEVYLEDFKSLLEKFPDKLYCCDCTANDITGRARENDTGLAILERLEKYPEPCDIVQFKVFDSTGSNLVNEVESKVDTKHEAIKNPASNMLASNSSFWRPFDIGYMKERKVSFIVDLGDVKEANQVEIVWSSYPVLHYIIEVSCNQRVWNKVAEVTKRGSYFVEQRPGVPYERYKSDVISFAPQKVRYIKFTALKFAYSIRREYAYDGYCRGLNKKFDLDDVKTVVRIKYDNSVRESWYDFVRGVKIPSPRDGYNIVKYLPPLDVAIFFDKETDLVSTGCWDDMRHGVTHVIRGIDLYPFFLLEIQVSNLLDYKKNMTFHSMILNPKGTKYSKFIGSTRICDYNLQPEVVISYLAYRAGIIPKLEKVSLDALVNTFDFKGVTTQNIIIDEREFLQTCQSLY